MKRITTIRRVVTSSVMTLMLLLHVAAAKAQVGFPNPQAIWTAGDSTLTFVDWEFWYRVGDTFNGQTVTAVWYGFDYDHDSDVTESASAPAWNRSTPAWNSTVSETLTTVVFDESFQDISPTNCCKWFANCQSLQTITGIENLNTSEVTNMSEMFSECWSLTSLDVSSFDTSNVTNMEGMFFNCNSLTSLDVSSFNTSNVTDMGSMFQECSSLTSLDVTNFVTSNVTNMECMFQDCSSLTSLDLSNFNTSSVENMHGMFDTCSGLTSLDLSNFDTSNVTEMGNMFLYCSSLTTIVCNDTWTPTSSTNMFLNCTSLVGGAGTAYDASHIDAAYARVDDAFTPGYFTSTTPYIPQAIWTAGNTTLTFISSPTTYAKGNTFDGQTVTAVWSGTDVTASGNANPAWLRQALMLTPVSPNLTKVVFDDSFESVRPTSLASWFKGCGLLTEIQGISNLNTSEVTNMSSMFNGCRALTSLDVSNFNTSNVRDMSSMFNGCRALTSLDVSNFNTTKVTNMASMFMGCSNLTSLNLPNPWFVDTAMFKNCSKLTSLDLSNAIFSSNPAEAFYGCSSLRSLNLSNVNTSYATDMSSMFQGCMSLTSLNLSDFDTSNVTNGARMFVDCINLTTIYCSNDWSTHFTSSSSDGMFGGCTSLVGGAGTAFDASHIDAAYARVDDAFTPGYFTSTTPYIPQAIWTAGNTTLTFVNAATQYAINDTFNGETVTAVWSGTDVTASASTPAWNSTVSATLTKVVFDSSFASVHPTSLGAWFSGCSQLTEIEGMSNLNTSEVTSMRSMFNNCSALTSLDLSNFDTSNVTDMSSMFGGCSALTSLNVSNFNTNNVTDMSNMFDVCSTLTSLDVSNFDTSSVTTMYYMFGYCSGLMSLDLSNFDTSKVTNMYAMFNGCSALTSLDLSNFDTRKVTNMMTMFVNCRSLITIICDSTWTATSSNNMFAGCTRLVGGAGTAYDASHRDATYAHPDGGTTNPGYFTSSTEVITANKPGDKETYWATYYYSGSYTVAIPAEEQSVKIYTARYSEEEGEKTLVLTEVTDGVIMGGQGVIIESNQPSITMKHSLTRTATDDDFFAENELKGRDHACALPTDEGTIYTMGNVGGQLGFYKYTGSQLKARRAYLAIPAGSEAGIRIRFADEDTATGIDEVQSTIDKVQSASIYDLQGRRVVNPTKGIYIVNGKKVYMK